MNTPNTMQAPVVKKETKNKIRVDFDRTPLLERLKTKYLSLFFLKKAVWFLFRFILMLGISYVILFPFFSKIFGSFMSTNDFVDVTVRIIPKEFNVDMYKYIILENHYFEAFLNTTLLSLLCAVIQTFVCCLIAYGLAKFKFKGNKLILIMVVVIMIIPHKTISFALQQHFRYFDLLNFRGLGFSGILTSLHIIDAGTGWSWLNTPAPLVLLSATGLAFKNGLYIFMLRQFFRGVPDELEESAYVDGSGVMHTFFKIIIPLSIPMMITVFLFSFSWQWTDEFYTTLFYSGSLSKRWTLMPDIYKNIPESLMMPDTYAGKTLYETAIKNTAGIMIIAPLVVVYLFCQKYLVQGIERSGIVG